MVRHVHLNPRKQPVGAKALQAEACRQAGHNESGVALLHAVLNQLLFTHASQRLENTTAAAAGYPAVAGRANVERGDDRQHSERLKSRVGNKLHGSKAAGREKAHV